MTSEEIKKQECNRFGEVIGELISRRIVRDMKDFAERIGVTPQSIYDTRAGRTGVSKRMLTSLEQEYNVSRAFILRGELPIFTSDKEEEPQSSIMTEGDSLRMLIAQNGELIKQVSTLTQVIANLSQK